ncbi:MAG: hypothetical protein ACYYK0_06250 [Candidatus Eutrophobiaceae bacterium]
MTYIIDEYRHVPILGKNPKLIRVSLMLPCHYFCIVFAMLKIRAPAILGLCLVFIAPMSPALAEQPLATEEDSAYANANTVPENANSTIGANDVPSEETEEAAGTDDKAVLIEPQKTPISHLVEVSNQDSASLDEELLIFQKIRMGVLLNVQLCRESPLDTCKSANKEISFLLSHLKQRISRLTSGNLSGTEDTLESYRTLRDLLHTDQQTLQLALVGRPDASQEEVLELLERLEKELGKYETDLPEQDDDSEPIKISISDTPIEDQAPSAESTEEPTFIEDIPLNLEEDLP